MFALKYLCVFNILLVRKCPDLYGVNGRIVTYDRRLITRTLVTVTRDWFQRVPSTVSSATDPTSDLRTTPTGLVTGRKLPPVTPYAWGKKIQIIYLVSVLLGVYSKKLRNMPLQWCKDVSFFQSMLFWKESGINTRLRHTMQN